MSDDRPLCAGADAELMELIEVLHRTYSRIRDITGEETDAVIHQRSGTAYLMPESQGQLRLTGSLERRHASERAAILDALSTQIALLDAEGYIVAVNEGWRRFGVENGLSDDYVTTGRNYLRICDEAQGRYADRAGEVAAGIRAVISGASNRFTLEYPCHSRQKQRWFTVTVTPLEETAPRGVVVMHVDISKRVQAQQRAEELSKRLERLIDQASVGILLHRNFVPILANRAVARLFGYDDPADIIALGNIGPLFAEDERSRVQDYNVARLKDGTAPELYRVRGNRRDGAKLVLENRAFTINWGDGMAVCAMFTDITDSLETEEYLRQSQRMDAIGQLTGGVAHDFNNILTVILGNAEVLSESLADDRSLQNLADMIARAAERGAELTARLLAFARKQPLDPAPTDVNELIVNLDGMLRRTLGEHIHIELALGPDLQRAMIDRGQLENAILNLCLNARDAMPEGGRLTVETENAFLDAAPDRPHDEISPGEYVLIAISDTGTGMEPDILERAFEPFFTTKDVGKGSGLGLSMVYGFAKQSNGHVKISSGPGTGTSVRLYLPRAMADQASATGTGAACALVEGGNEHILVVEDEQFVRGHVTAMLRGLGYRVTQAATGPKALEFIKQTSDIDLLFTDIVMPGGMTGHDLAETVTQMRPTIKVLFTSGYAEESAIHGCRLAAGWQMLRKPYKRQELAAKVRLALGDTG